jgi:GLPGLI family protein
MGSNDVLFTDLVAQKTTEQKELFDKTFIVDDSIHRLQWKILGETKTVMNHNCTRAEATRVSKKIAMNMDNGTVTRKEIQDTSRIVAWFTGEIPVSTGPAEFQGQLPGLILEMNIGDGKQVYAATAIDAKVDLADIKQPSGKKHCTPDEFRQEQTKMMDEMQKNMPGKVKFKSN